MCGASRRCCPGPVFLQRRPAGCCGEAKRWWAATVLPRILRFKRPLHHSLMLASPRKWIGGLMKYWINGKERPTIPMLFNNP
jgi:hypothetical protein